MRRIITPEMIKAGARFNAFAADERDLGQRVVIPIAPDRVELDRFILISTKFETSLNSPRTAEELAAIMTDFNGYEPVTES